MRTMLPLTVLSLLGLSDAAGAERAPTFHKDVEPILQARCQGCHRPGEAAPMPLLTYEQARPWAEAIREAVLTKRMPPWFAEPNPAGWEWRNDPSLTEGELRTLVSWAETGAQQGDLKDAPPPLEFVEGWNIGVPDAVLEMPQSFDVPATGTIEYQWVVIPAGFTEDKWVRGVEVRPGDRSVVHHVTVFARYPGSDWLAHVPPGVFTSKNPEDNEPSQLFRLIGGFVPGSALRALPEGRGMPLPAGSDIVLQMHYTASGKPASDKTKLGFVFAKTPPEERFLALPVMTSQFAIPPYAANHRVDAWAVLDSDVRVTGFLPHMHLRGKAFEMRVILPSGEEETVLRVPRYDFNWQLRYELAEERVLPKGTRIEAAAWFDNSPNNPVNPDPSAEVRWGDQSWEEMMVGFMYVAIPRDQDPETLYRRNPPAASATDE